MLETAKLKKKKSKNIDKKYEIRKLSNKTKFRKSISEKRKESNFISMEGIKRKAYEKQWECMCESTYQ